MIRRRGALSSVVFGAGLLGASGVHAQERFGLGAGLLVPIDIRVDGDPVRAEPGPMLRVTVDTELSPSLDAGGYLHVASITAEERDEQVNLFEIGAALRWRVPLEAERAELRLGGGIGYRRWLADAPRFDGVQGLAANVDAELSGRIGPGLTGRVTLGLLGQPYGRNADHTVLALPMPYLTLGARF